jgi:hypothetical protein
MFGPPHLPTLKFPIGRPMTPEEEAEHKSACAEYERNREYIRTHWTWMGGDMQGHSEGEKKEI